MRTLACLALLLSLAACRTARITYVHPLEDVPYAPPIVATTSPTLPSPPPPPSPLQASGLGAPAPAPVVPPRPAPVPVYGTASVMIQTMGNQRGPRGYMRYQGDVVAIDGVPFRAARKTFRVAAGKHVITVEWQNYQVPDWVGTGYDGMATALFLQAGVSDVEIDVEPSRYYQVKWPYDDEPGGPHGIRDVTR